MATILQGFFDESGKEDDPEINVCSLAGYVAPKDSWRDFETKWKAVLSAHGVDYLHVREFAHSTGPYKKWKNNEERRSRFLQDLIAVASAMQGLRGVVTSVFVDDLRRYVAEYDKTLTAYSFCLAGCLMELHNIHPTVTMQGVADKVEEPLAKIDQAFEFLNEDWGYRVCADHITIEPLPKAQSSKDIIPLQLADLAAWEARKQGDRQFQWINGSSDDEKTLKKWWSWIRRTQRTSHWSGHRYSAVELGKATPLQGNLWRYPALVELETRKKAGNLHEWVVSLMRLPT